MTLDRCDQVVDFSDLSLNRTHQSVRVRIGELQTQPRTTFEAADFWRDLFGALLFCGGISLGGKAVSFELRNSEYPFARARYSTEASDCPTLGSKESGNVPY